MATTLADHQILEGSHQNGDDSPIDTEEQDKEGQRYEPITRKSTVATLGPEELDIEESDGPPKHAGFWDHSMVNVRFHVIKLWARTVLILFVAIILILSCFEGVYHNIPANIKNLTVFVVDFDGKIDPYVGETALVGPQIVQATKAIVKSEEFHLGFLTMPPSHFNNDPIAVRQAVYDFTAWAAIIINANATALLRQAVEQGNSSYDPNGAAQVIYVTARDQTTIPSYVVPRLVGFEAAMVAKIGSLWARSVVSNTTLSPENLAKAPQAISPAIGFTTYDLRPFGPAGATPWVSIALIYLIIIAFFSFSFFLPIHFKYLSPRGNPPLHFHQLIIWRWFATVAAYFLLSLAYSLVPLAFQIPLSNAPASPTEPALNTNAYGKGTFVVFWMLNFVGMAALGLACENVAMAVGQPWTAIWLIFWVITNVSTGFYSLDLSPGWYKWGYAWPLHQVVEASHQILFDLHSRIGLNFGILFVWVAINTALFPLACYLMRWKTEREQRLKRVREQQWLTAMSRPRTNLGVPKRGVR